VLHPMDLPAGPGRSANVSPLIRTFARRRAKLPAMPQKHRLDDVYGVARDVPINYVARELVDGEFVLNLARDKHIVVFGSSKQGKTCLRKSNLNDTDYIVVTCSNKWTLTPIVQ
jgi:hypothetical protein